MDGEFSCNLVPTALFRAGGPATPPLAILGTCIAEHLTNIAVTKNPQTAHFLKGTWLNEPLPEVDWQVYEGAVVHLTLRQLLDMATGFGNGDLSYIMPDETELTALAEKASTILRQFVDQLRDAIKAPVPLFFLALLEPPQTTRGLFADNRHLGIYRLVRNLNDALSAHLAGAEGAYYIETNDIVRYFGDGSCSDSYWTHFTHAGVFLSQQSDNIYRAILERVYHALHVLNLADPVKLIITDLDNTLWKGVAAEEDEIIPWRHMEGWPTGYAEALFECKRRGILLAIASKNDEAKTQENFKKLLTPKLRIQDFCSAKINWRPKSENIAEILVETNLLPGNVLFIDDNPLEIDEVKTAYPEIRTLTYPAEQWRNVLLHSPQTQTVRLTEEAKQKTELIQAKIARDVEATTTNREDWLNGLKLHLTIEEVADTKHKSYPRCLELLNKTNQFNTTGQRWTEAEMAAFLAAGGKIISASAQDRFANHGLIGLMLVKKSTIHQAVLSCRVFGLGIETCMLRAAMQTGKTGSNIQALHSDTGKNAACRSFYSQHGFALTADGAWSGSIIPAIPDWISVDIEKPSAEMTSDDPDHHEGAGPLKGRIARFVARNPFRGGTA